MTLDPNDKNMKIRKSMIGAEKFVLNESEL